MAELECRFAAMIVDFDGVIVESTTIKTAAFRALFADRSDRIDAIIALHRHNVGVDRLTKFEMIYRDILHEPLAGSAKRELGARFARLVEDAVVQCPMVPGAVELLRALDGHVPVAVVSATPQSELDRIVARRGIGHCFCAVRGSPPDKTETVRRLLAEEGWDSARVLMIGDADADLVAARSNGIAFIGRLTPEDPHEFPSDVSTVRDLMPLADAANRVRTGSQATAKAP